MSAVPAFQSPRHDYRVALICAYAVMEAQFRCDCPQDPDLETARPEAPGNRRLYTGETTGHPPTTTAFCRDAKHDGCGRGLFATPARHPRLERRETWGTHSTHSRCGPTGTSP